MNFQSTCNGFHLQLLGYQFPHATVERYDANWLTVEGTVRHAGGVWSFRDPCFLTWEVAELVAWLDGLERRSAGSEIAFMEPNLAFAWIPGDTLRISFAAEAAPPQDQRLQGDGDFSLMFSVRPQSLKRAARELHAQLARFPER